MGFWPDEALAWYQNASEMFAYPMLPYGELMKDLISEQDTVLDLGCGPGVATIMMAPWCKRVLALDSDEQALQWLSRQQAL